jgi:hypothetical protein
MPPNVPLPAFTDLLAGVARSAVHLEMRDAYAVDYESGPFAEWRRGHRHDPADQASWWRPWLSLVEETVARGVVIRRARIVSEPVSDGCRTGRADAPEEGHRRGLRQDRADAVPHPPCAA